VPPQRGHAQVAPVAGSVVAGAGTDGLASPRRLRVTATRAARHVFARNPTTGGITLRVEDIGHLPQAGSWLRRFPQ
jgi:hypothetical protein